MSVRIVEIMEQARERMSMVLVITTMTEKRYAWKECFDLLLLSRTCELVISPNFVRVRGFGGPGVGCRVYECHLKRGIIGH
jgi:hypothetical protein